MTRSTRRSSMIVTTLVLAIVTGCGSSTPMVTSKPLPTMSMNTIGSADLSPVLTRTGTSPDTLAPFVITPNSCHGINGKADRRCTPGAVNQLVLQDAATHYSHTICAPSPGNGEPTWIHDQRPPTAYTNSLKALQMPEYGLSQGRPNQAQMSSTEEDHFFPIEDGGDPRNPLNLWPEPWVGPEGARAKDADEGRVHRMICGSQQLTVEQGLAIITAKWSHA